MKKQIIVLACAFALSSVAASAYDLVENFSTNPLLPGSGWSFGEGDNSNNQFTWDSTTSSLDVHLNSSLPTARLDLPLGTTFTGSTDFTLTARFSFTVTSAPSDQQMQFAFGLTNSVTTGADRTGSNANFSSDDTFNTVEYDYFPNVDPIFGGPTLTPTVFGAQSGSNDAFSNFASVFGPSSLLTGNPLPTATELQATLAYSALGQTLTLTIQQVNPDDSLTLLDTVPLSTSSLDPTFSVDTLSIMAYNDGFTTSSDPSLVGDMSFQSFEVVPEPSSVGFLSLGAAGAFAWWKRRRK